MDLQDECSRFGLLPSATLRNLSSSSSAFFSANQSPFFSPRSQTCQLSTCSDDPSNDANTNVDLIRSGLDRLVIPDHESPTNVRFSLSDAYTAAAPSTSSDFQKFAHVSSYGIGIGNDYSRQRKSEKDWQKPPDG